jgi:Flp pilus assembly pilin Flp
MHNVLVLLLTLQRHAEAGVSRLRARPLHRLRPGDRGQATTEYALVLLGAALVALLLVAWATSGGGAGKIGRLLDRVLDTITGKL